MPKNCADKKKTAALNAFATLIQNVATILNVKITWIEVVVLLLRGPTKFMLEGAGDLNLVQVGDGPSRWFLFLGKVERG